MAIVLATHDSVFGRYVAATLSEAVAIDRIIIERTHATRRFYLRKLQRVGPVNFAFQAWLNRWFRREGARHLPRLPLPPHESTVSMNRCTFAPDDVVLCFGTSYITQRTLSTVPGGFLNLHTGWLPDYRGVKSEFWVLKAGDLERVGWTLHVMSPSLDGGDIVLRRRVAWAGANPAALRAALLRDAVPALAELVRSVRAHGLPSMPRTPQHDGHYYTTPTWREWRTARNSR